LRVRRGAAASFHQNTVISVRKYRKYSICFIAYRPENKRRPMAFVITFKALKLALP
jgi:hypothetical protein